MNVSPKVLIIEDERALALAFAAAVRHAGAASEMAPTAAQARRKLRDSGPFEAMILDIGLPDQNGLKFLESLPERQRLPTFIVTAHGEIGNAISARKLGVREFFTKPLDFDSFTGVLSAFLRTSARSIPSPERQNTTDAAFIGAAPEMRSVFRQIAHACASDEPVLIRGETGTGKTRVAHLIRQHSRCGSGPMEIFSAGVGSPEGALQRSLEGAEGGSLIIENLAALGPGDQIELVSRIESTSSGFPRILATCGPDLHDAVTRGEFRSDLYYRLQVLEIRLPPLRERLEDLPVLTEFFVAQLAPGRIVETTEETLKRLIAHDWPGNLRELRNVISYALTAGAGASQISPSNLPPYFFDEKGVNTTTKNELPVKLSQELGHWVEDCLRGEVVPSYDELSNKLEAALLRDLLRRFDGKLARLANELKANRSTLRRKLGGTATPR